MKVATVGQLTDEDHRTWGVADDLKIVVTVSDAPYNP